jgi:hypothetical protein
MPLFFLFSSSPQGPPPSLRADSFLSSDKIQVQIIGSEAREDSVERSFQRSPACIAGRTFDTNIETASVQCADGTANHFFSGSVSIHLRRIDQPETRRRSFPDSIHFLFQAVRMFSEIPGSLADCRQDISIFQCDLMLLGTFLRQ